MTTTTTNTHLLRTLHIQHTAHLDPSRSCCAAPLVPTAPRWSRRRMTMRQRSGVPLLERERRVPQRRCGIPVSSAGGAERNKTPQYVSKQFWGALGRLGSANSVAPNTRQEESPDGRPTRSGSHALPAGAEELRVKCGPARPKTATAYEHASGQLYRCRVEQFQPQLRSHWRRRRVWQ